MENNKRYTVKEAAALINRSAYTLGRWQNEGLITPKRDDRGYRYFTDEDIKQMEEIKKLKVDIMLSGGGYND